MKSINKITILNICSTILLQGITFFTTPIFTRILGSEQYGRYSIFNSWISILICVLGLGVTNTLATGRYQFRNTYYEFRSCILLFGTLISLITVGIPILLFLNPIADFLGYSKWLTILLFVVGLSHYVVGFIQGACIYEKKAVLNFGISIILSITSVVFSLILISIFEQNNKYLGRIYGTAIPYIVIAFILWIIFFLKKPIGLRKKYCTYSLKVGFPVVFHTLAHSVLSQSDRLMMQRMNISDSEIGIYSFYYSFAGVIATILNVLNNSWSPFYYDDLDEENWDALKIKCKNYIELFTILTVGFLLLCREVNYIMGGREYWDGINVIFLIVLAFYFTFMYQFFVNFEFFHKKTQIIAIGTFIAAIINIILNTFMIPSWGMYGAAIATALSYAALFIFHSSIVMHMKEHQYHLKRRIFVPGILAVSGTIALFYVLADFWYIRWICGVILGIYELKKIIARKSIF